MTDSGSALIIAFVSGKGGVGKTMLAVATAKELSEARRTLLIDLDFFNRGLTGLFKGGTAVAKIQPPSFLPPKTTEPGQSDSEWQVKEVSKNLMHVEYPDLSRDAIERFEVSEIRKLTNSLREFVLKAAALAKCECVILDCHGGPDNSSFAACLLADFAILVSEPDKITFYGTLHFLRRLEYARGDDPVDIRLIFNKVVPGFSGFFLAKFYDEQVKDLFHGRPLLAIFPLEVYLTKEFEKEPLLTRVYPNSFLARKTQQLLFDLLSENFPQVLPTCVKKMPTWVRKYRRYALGRSNPLLSLDVIFGTLATFVLLLLSIGWLESFLAPRLYAITDQVSRLELAVLVAHNRHFFDEYSSEVQAALTGQLPARDVFTDIDHALYDAQLKDAKSGKTIGNAVPWSTVQDRSSASEIVQQQWEHLTEIEGLEDYPWEVVPSTHRYLREFGDYPSYRPGRLASSSQTGSAIYFRNFSALADIEQVQLFQSYISDKTRFTPPTSYLLYAKDADALKKATRGNSIYVWGYLRRFTAVVESEWAEIVFFGWFMLAILADQTVRIDRRFIYAVRQKRLFKAAAIQILVWGLRVFMVGLWLFIMKSTRSGHEYTKLFVFGTLVISILLAMGTHVYSTYRQIRYERRWAEALVRTSALLVVAGIAFVILQLS